MLRRTGFVLFRENARYFREKLLKDGFCVVPGVLSAEKVAEFKTVSEKLLAAPENKQFQEDKFTGSLIPVSKDPAFAHLIAHGPFLDTFTALGFRRPRWLSGFIISKPAPSPSLAWHQDGWYWDYPCSYQQKPVQLFAMYYLSDTSRENGCLRVVPGSHNKENALHAELKPAHSKEVRSAEEKLKHWRSDPLHQAADGCLDVAVKAGDLVLGDARVLHAANPNESNERRTLITLWYFPEYDEVPRPMQEAIAKLHLHQMGELQKDWPEDAVKTMDALLPERFGLRHSKGDEYDHNLDFMVRQPGWCDNDDRSAKTWREMQSEQETEAKRQKTGD